jgi:hypothetical protein
MRFDKLRMRFDKLRMRFDKLRMSALSRMPINESFWN